MGDSDAISVGETVYAVGNPLGELEFTMTTGSVSALNREIVTESGTDPINMFQIDAAVNSGNSGGALVNADGKLVGINTAIASGNGFYTGYSFAIPSNIVKKIYLDLKNYGQVQKAFLGVSIMELNAKLADEYELDDVRGIYVAEVEEDGAAAKNDFQEGDVILSIDNQPVNSLAEVRGVLKTKSPGDSVNIFYIRNKEKYSKVVTLLNNQGTTDLLKKE